MLSRLPHEVRLDIFDYAFATSHGRRCIRVEDTAEGITYNLTNEYGKQKYAGAISCLDAAIFGEGVAAAAAEALYRSRFIFKVDAKTLCTFLQNCPLSHLEKPGQFIKRLHLYMDQDPNFVGDGRDGQALRKADWVDLEPGPGDDRTTSSGDRTQLMRQCWRAILKMPRLRHFEFWIMPSQGKASADDIQSWEIRDILPMHFRLFCKQISARIFLRTWEIYQDSIDSKDEHQLSRARDSDPQENSCYESAVNLTSCIPHNWAKPTAHDQAKAQVMWPRMEAGALLDRYARRQVHAVRNYNALHGYHRRLVADKTMPISLSFPAGTVAEIA